MTVIDSPATLDRYVQIPNFRLHYLEQGHGLPLVLLHGSGPGATGLTNYARNIGPLAEHFRVIAVDMPGWGESDTQTDRTGRDHVASLIHLLDALEIERAALVGNSMGGMTAVGAAMRYPERVSHLITMGAPAPGTPIFASGDGWSEGMKVLMQAYREPTAANMKRLVQVMVFDTAWATDELAQARSAAALSKPEHLDSWNSQFDGPPNPQPYFAMANELRTITAPSLIIHGRDDRVVHFENGLHLVAAIPNSRLVLVNQCGHWLQIEHAEEFNRLVTSFLLANS